jgi:hypothetical protein
MTKQYHVEARWDPEAQVFYAKSNIPGLNIEAASIAEFIEIVRDIAPDLIKANDPTPERRSRTVRLEADLDLLFV